MILKKIIFVLLAGLIILSCEDTFDLELQDNPNFPSPAEANLDALYASVQLNFAEFLNGPIGSTSVNDITMQLSRQRAFTSSNDYANAFSPTTLDNLWRQAYSDFMPDANEVIRQADEKGLSFIGGTSKILKAYVLMTLVDMFGDVPLGESDQGVAFISPNRDPGAAVYAAAEALLLEGVADLQNPTTSPTTDNFFGGTGSASDWADAANNLLIKLYVTTKLVDTEAGSKMIAIINSPEYNPTPANFVFNYTSNRANPDSRHPFYQNSYETSD